MPVPMLYLPILRNLLNPKPPFPVGWVELAAKRRHIHSLGREPQEHGTEKILKPRSGDRQPEDDGCGSRRSHNLSPLQGSLREGVSVLGLTPQAMYLSRLRRSVVCAISETRTRKNLGRFSGEPATDAILHIEVSGEWRNTGSCLSWP